MEKKKYMVSVYHRNPSNGIASGRMTAFNIGEICFYPKDDRGISFRYDDNYAWIGNKKIKLSAIGRYVGNWCWDDILISREDLEAFIGKVWGKFGIEEGKPEIVEFWDSAKPFNTEEFVKLLGE